MKKVFYKPQDGWVGDVIPFYDHGEYKLYYLHDQRAGGDYGNHTTWNLITTKNGLDFKDYGVALPNGGEAEPDRNAYTGSVIKDQNGMYHLFYTGHNPNPEFCVDGKPLQVVLKATGSDGIHWTKDENFKLYGDGVIYEKFDWRDPFVFFNEERQEYWMLVTSRLVNSSEKKAGVLPCSLPAISCTGNTGSRFTIRTSTLPWNVPIIFKWETGIIWSTRHSAKSS